jgi:hypothetical protein
MSYMISYSLAVELSEGYECKYEEYLNILEIKYAILLCRFRTTNNKFPIETGRWQNIPRENRK